jgi:hypothetical protein
MARAVALKREARERRLERSHVRALPGCAIRRNQAQSGAIRCNQVQLRALPGCAIRCNQMQSGAIMLNYEHSQAAQSGAIRCNQVQLRALPGCVLRTRMHRAGPNRRGRLEGDRMQSEEIGGRLAGDRRQNQWQSEATSPARRQSEEAIRGHQRPSEATSPACRHRACTRRRVRHISAGADRQSSSPRHQLPSGAISSRGNQTQSDAIRRNQTQSNALERTRARPSDAIRGHSGPIRRNRRSLRGHPEASPRPLPTKQSDAIGGH